MKWSAIWLISCKFKWNMDVNLGSYWFIPYGIVERSFSTKIYNAASVVDSCSSNNVHIKYIVYVYLCLFSSLNTWVYICGCVCKVYPMVLLPIHSGLDGLMEGFVVEWNWNHSYIGAHNSRYKYDGIMAIRPIHH